MASSSSSTRMLQNNLPSLWGALSAVDNLSARHLFSAEMNLALGELTEGSSLYGHGDELRGRSVLIATTSQLAAALALIELDGVATRIVLCPPDLPLGYLPFVIETADVNAIVSDGRTVDLGNPRVERFVPCNGEITHGSSDRSPEFQTEWILLTSGTSGLPKLVAHTLSSLTGAVSRQAPSGQIVW